MDPTTQSKITELEQTIEPGSPHSIQSPQLPIEVWERVIDVVAYDDIYYHNEWNTIYSNLLSCALTCRAWFPRSRLHLTRRLVLKDADHFKRHIILLKQYFAANLTCETLTIRWPSTHFTVHSTWISCVPIRLAFALGHLAVLHLSGVDFFFMHSSFIPALSIARSVTKLHLFYVTFTLPAQFVRLVASFPQLTLLALRSVKIFPVDYNSESPIGVVRLPQTRWPIVPALRRIKLRRVEVYYLDPDISALFFDWMLAASFFRTVEFLWIEGVLNEVSAASQAGFISACPRLDYIAFVPTNDDMDQNIFDCFTLEHNFSISLVDLSIPIPDLAIRLFSSYVRLLSTAAKTRLAHICGSFTFSDESKISLIHWEEIGALLLSHPRTTSQSGGGSIREGDLSSPESKHGDNVRFAYIRSVRFMLGNEECYGRCKVTHGPYLSSIIQEAEKNMLSLLQRRLLYFQVM